MLANGDLRVNNLTVQVVDFHRVLVSYAKSTNACCRKVEGRRRSKATSTDNKDTRT